MTPCSFTLFQTIRFLTFQGVEGSGRHEGSNVLRSVAIPVQALPREDQFKSGRFASGFGEQWKTLWGAQNPYHMVHTARRHLVLCLKTEVDDRYLTGISQVTQLEGETLISKG